MRGRMALTTLLLAALALSVGCKHMTPEERRQKQLDKQAAAQAKMDQKRAEADAKAAAAAQKKQAEMDRKQAEAQAKADKKQAAEDKKRQDAMAKEQAKQADAQAKADKKAADAKAAEDKKQADMLAKEQKKQAAALAKAQKQHEAAAAEPMAMASKTPAPAAASESYPDDRLKVIGYPYIEPENRQRIFDRYVEAMAASGEAHDATLTDADFDGAELNATGRSKLALALQYPKADNKLTIYVTTTGGEDVSTARAAAVERYWKASKFSTVQLTTKDGPNPSVTAPASAGIAAMRRMEREQQPGNATSSGMDTTGGRSRIGGSSGGSSGQ